jgi:hypothetical protein
MRCRGGTTIVFFVAAICSSPLSQGVPVSGAEPAPEWKQLFDSGFQRGAAPGRIAREAYGELKKQAPADPRVDYAWGLVKLRQSQIRTAETAFADAADLDPDYLPARRAWLWTLVLQKKFADATKQLDALATRLGDENSKLPPAARHESAAWLGALSAAVELSLPEGKTHDTLAAEFERAGNTLGKNLAAAFHEGRKSFQEKVAREETEEAASTGADNGSKSSVQEKRQQQEEERLSRSQAKAEGAKENLKRSAEEWQKWYDAEIARSNRQLQDLEREMNGIGSRMVQVQREYQLAAAQEAQLLRQKPKAGSSAAAELSNVQSRKNALAGEGANLTLSLAQTQQQSRAALAKRSLIVQQFQKATGQIVKQDAAVARLQDRMDAKEKELQNSPAKTAPAQRTGTPAFRSLFDLDEDAERGRLFKELGIAVEEDA